MDEDAGCNSLDVEERCAFRDVNLKVVVPGGFTCMNRLSGEKV